VIPDPEATGYKPYTQPSKSGGSGGGFGSTGGGSGGGGSNSGGGEATKKQGPAGSNLFVFHLPNEWKENDLIEAFRAYGTIVSARIMTDRNTGRSKGFGFVSYDNPQSAINAIERMNGFKIFNKALKVELKKGDNDDFSGISGGGAKYQPY